MLFFLNHKLKRYMHTYGSLFEYIIIYVLLISLKIYTTDTIWYKLKGSITLYLKAKNIRNPSYSKSEPGAYRELRVQSIRWRGD